MTQGLGPMGRLSAWWSSFTILPKSSKKTARQAHVDNASHSSLQQTRTEDRMRPPHSLKRKGSRESDMMPRQAATSQRANRFCLSNIFRNWFSPKPAQTPVAESSAATVHPQTAPSNTSNTLTPPHPYQENSADQQGSIEQQEAIDNPLTPSPNTASALDKSDHQEELSDNKLESSPNQAAIERPKEHSSEAASDSQPIASPTHEAPNQTSSTENTRETIPPETLREATIEQPSHANISSEEAVLSSPQANLPLYFDVPSALSAIQKDVANLKYVDPKVLDMVNPDSDATFLQVILFYYPNSVLHLPDSIPITERLIESICYDNPEILKFADKFQEVAFTIVHTEPKLLQYLPSSLQEEYINLPFRLKGLDIGSLFKEEQQPDLERSPPTDDEKLRLFRYASPLVKNKMITKQPNIIKNGFLKLQLQVLSSVIPPSYFLLQHAHPEVQLDLIIKNITITKKAAPLSRPAAMLQGTEFSTIENFGQPQKETYLIPKKPPILEETISIDMLMLKAASHEVQANAILEKFIDLDRNPTVLRQLDPKVQWMVINKNPDYVKYAGKGIQQEFAKKTQKNPET